jgi:hypothetical protein
MRVELCIVGAHCAGDGFAADCCARLEGCGWGAGHVFSRSRGLVTGMKGRGAAGSAGLLAAGAVGVVGIRCDPPGQGTPGEKHGGQAGLVRWAGSPCK